MKTHFKGSAVFAYRGAFLLFGDREQINLSLGLLLAYRKLTRLSALDRDFIPKGKRGFNNPRGSF